MNDNLVPVLIPVILGILLRLASAEKPTPLEDNSLLLRYGKAIRIFGIGMPLFLLGFFIYAILNGPPNAHEGVKSLIVLLCLPFPFLLYFYLEFFKVKIIVNDQKIIATTPWQGRREYLWSEIDEITYSPSFRWFRIKAKGKKMLYISTLISGIDGFWEKTTHLLPSTTYEKALKKLQGK